MKRCKRKSKGRCFRWFLFSLLSVFALVCAACGSDTAGGGGDGDAAGLNNNLTAEAGVNENGNVNTNGNTNENNNENTNGNIGPGADAAVGNACNNYSPWCEEYVFGEDPIPIPSEDPNSDTSGVSRDPNGDIILDSTNMDFNYLWIANEHDNGRGSVSKIDSEAVTEAARYYTVTCFGNDAYQNGECLDVSGAPIQYSSNRPSRTGVDFNFDVWVANRSFIGQASATKIANSLDDCIDRNGDGIINTSHDWDGDGRIEVDCDGDGIWDDINTLCPNGNPPEFLGLDDECVLHTTNYGGHNYVGRSVCLDAGDPYEGGAGNVWVGTFSRSGNNRFYKIDGEHGGILETVDLPSGINIYGCAVDGQGILWGTDIHTGRIIYLNTENPSQVGPVLNAPYSNQQHYGIAVDGENNIWMGGWGSRNVIRYTPDRTSFSTLKDGYWTRIRTIEHGGVDNTRGIAADLRGWVWVASNNGYIVRIPGDIGVGDHSWADAEALGAQRLDVALGEAMIGVGVDFSGHVWGISRGAHRASRIDLDVHGDPIDLQNNVYEIPVGQNPYTYSDFTGYGLRNFVRPRGTYRYILEGCQPEYDTRWLRVEWDATKPQGTDVRLRVRTGDAIGAFGDWFGVWDTSPAILKEPPQGPIWPDPARYIQVEFELSSQNQEISPILHGFTVVRDCEGSVVE